MRSDGASIASVSNLLQDVEDFKSLEELCIGLAKCFLEKCLEELDEYLLKNKPKGYICVGFRERTLQTRVGDIRLRRRFYVRATKKRRRGEKGRFLLDEALKIPARKSIVGGLLKLAVSLSTRLPFRGVSEVLEEAGFGYISHQMIHNIVKEYGKRQIEHVDSLRKGLFLEGKEPAGKKEKVPILFIEADGVHVNSQETNNRSMEIKLGAVHEGWEENGNKKNRRLKNLRVFMSLNKGGDAFWEEFMVQLLKHYEINENVVIVVNGDGAEWIQRKVKEYFPQAIVQIDRFHLIRDVYRAFGSDAKKLIEILNDGGVTTFLDTLESLECQGATPKARLRRKQLVGFLRRYEEHLLDYRLRLPRHIDKSGLYGMGAAETLVDKKLANRMKKRGMRWSRSGAHSMAVLLMLKSNKQLFSWLDEAFLSVPTNPRKELKKYTNRSTSGEWLQKSLAIISTSRPWQKALMNIVTPKFEII